MPSSKKSNSILVTGGAGYIGSHVATQLIEQGFEVVVVDNLSTGHLSLVPAEAVFYELDIGNKSDLSKLLKEHKIQTVIHFAASVKVEESVTNPMLYYQNNFIKTSSLLSACIEAGIDQFVFSSTAAVYGVTKELLVNEETETHPANPYGRSKLMVEWLLKDISRAHGMRYVILRYFNVAGAKLDGSRGQISKNATHLIKVATEAACGKREAVTVFGTDYPTIDGTGVRDYIHVDDLARAHIDSLRYLARGGNSVVLNCGYGKGFSVRNVISTIKEISGVDFQVIDSQRRAGDVPALIANASKIKEVLHWTPQYDDLSVICKSAFQWEKNNS